MACTPDVWRLCGAQVPDVDRIVACLRRNTSQLTDGAARFLNKATTHLGVVRIATTGKGVTIGAGVTIGLWSEALRPRLRAEAL